MAHTVTVNEQANAANAFLVIKFLKYRLFQNNLTYAQQNVFIFLHVLYMHSCKDLAQNCFLHPGVSA